MSASDQLQSAELGARLGGRLRERRRELGLTLADVAAAADVSTGYLSTIENASSIPSLPVLARLAHALQLSLAEILRTSASSRIARGALDPEPPVAPLAAEGSRLQIVRSTAAAGETGEAPLALGDTDVFLFVLDGRFEVTVDGAAFEVGPGDALHCDVPGRVGWRVAGDGPATALWSAAAGIGPR